MRKFYVKLLIFAKIVEVIKSFLRKIFKEKPNGAQPIDTLTIDFTDARKWEYIIIHHSKGPDKKTRDWEGIRRYHTSWRYKDIIISYERAKELKALGKVVESPWKDIGYQWGIELIGSQYVYRRGRKLHMRGAHCYQNDMNSKAIGICVLGDYDVVSPTEEQIKMLAKLCRRLMNHFNIPITHIKRHSDYANYKSCPGEKFDLSRLIVEIEKLKGV